MKENGKKTPHTPRRGYEVSTELHKRFKATATLRDVKMKDAAEQALTRWIESGVAKHDLDPSFYNAKNRDMHDLLEHILENGTPNQAEWISGNLKTFVDAINNTPANAVPRPFRKRA